MALMRIPMAEVYEVATFYAHFDVVKEGEAIPPQITVRVCDSVACAMRGSEELLKRLQDKGEHGVRFVRAPCMGRCASAPVAEVNHCAIDQITDERVLDAARAPRKYDIPSYQSLDDYLDGGGYQAYRACREGKLTLRRAATLALGDLGEAGLPALARMLERAPAGADVTLSAFDGSQRQLCEA